uniref:Uncharacterized protein n=1 Tax=Anguilla anguilla TaxID=7936 RepID=A0A0E9X7U6_ANGAN
MRVTIQKVRTIKHLLLFHIPIMPPVDNTHAERTGNLESFNRMLPRKDTETETHTPDTMEYGRFSSTFTEPLGLKPLYQIHKPIFKAQVFKRGPSILANVLPWRWSTERLKLNTLMISRRSCEQI